MYRRKKAGIFLLALLVLGAAALGGYAYIRANYTVETVYVEGNVHYTEEEIKEIVMDGFLGDNSLYLSLKYRNRGVENVPFVDVMDVEVLAPDTIRIIVYEKVLTGYIRYMDTYLYFDKDGYVVENSGVRTAGVPEITGLSFDHVVVGEQLPVEDESVFVSILNVTKLLGKYSLNADKIYLNGSGELTIYFGQVKATLGNDPASLEDKLMLLPELLPSLEGRSGTLQMLNLDEKYTFKSE
ncbi:MAG: FtsQ-type POTRA domain-containing protein [Roseburia sp.]|nr:FtsQ-type POTRA domain-containing protein [Roseburia sp.]MCM1099328.1 FtsQ-type POTRA domain-containing protein [Ruminococcus flavefaciens]